MTTDARLTPPRSFVGMPHDVYAFIERIGDVLVRDWLRARDAAGGHGREIASAFEIADAAVDAHGLRPEYRNIERRVARLVDGVQWFAANSSGVHGITLRDTGAMRLLASWAALAVLLGDRLDAQSFATLTQPFRSIGGIT